MNFVIKLPPLLCLVDEIIPLEPFHEQVDASHKRVLSSLVCKHYLNPCAQAKIKSEILNRMENGFLDDGFVLPPVTVFGWVNCIGYCFLKCNTDIFVNVFVELERELIIATTSRWLLSRR